VIFLVRAGQLVYSLAGHDRGEPFFVLTSEDKNRVLLINGKSRPLEKPKRKNVKHIVATESLSELFGGESLPTNKQIRRELSLLTDL
jgi:ribosomal protein L14E/L6E/L27E